MEKKTKEVDLGGGWLATVVRPRLATWLEWREVAYGDTTDDEPPEKGTDEPQKPKATTLPRAAYEYLENTLLPECVTKIKTPDGEETTGAELHFPDLGFGRLGTLTGELLKFMQEADLGATFRTGES